MFVVSDVTVVGHAISLLVERVYYEYVINNKLPPLIICYRRGVNGI